MGSIITFYSFKGGVGRTMALANIGVLLARKNLKVLLVDWDLEAPGLDEYFRSLGHSSPSRGLLDLLSVAFQETSSKPKWRQYLSTIEVEGGNQLDLLSSGSKGGDYASRVLSFDWNSFFENRGGGEFIETLRDEWKHQYDVVLIDSRTGFTDAGGICTIQLPDILTLVFSANKQSLDGAIDVAKRAQKARQSLVYDRMPLLVFPLPSRFDSRTEFEESQKWLDTFARQLEEFYDDWMPQTFKPVQMLEITKIPYVAYFSFGEKLPVLTHNISDPESLGFAYNVSASIIENDFTIHKDVFDISGLREEAHWDNSWIAKQRTKAENDLKQCSFKAFMEITFTVSGSKDLGPQKKLLASVETAQIHTFGWPIGVTLHQEENKPRPTGDGVVSELRSPKEYYDYWVLRKNGDFFLLKSLFEDHKGKTGELFVDTRIIRVTESLLFCARLYSDLSLGKNSTIRIGLRHGGIKGRVLSVASPNRLWHGSEQNKLEAEVYSEVQTQLFRIEEELVTLVKTLMRQLFMVFDFAEVSDGVYADIVNKFRDGKI